MLGSVESVLTIRFDTSYAKLASDFDVCTASTVTKVSHSFKSVCLIRSVKIINEHIISNLINGVVSSVENFVDKMVLSAILSDFSRGTPSS